MESQNYLPPQKKSNTGLIVGLVIGGVCLCCVLPVALIGGAGFWAFGKVKGIAGCTFAFKDAQKGVEKYSIEHGGKLPNAATWQDDVREDYRASMTPKKQLGPFDEMSPDGDWGCKDENGSMTGMAFNSDLSGKKLADIKDAANTILLFETAHASKNQHEKYKQQSFESSPKMFGKNRGWFQVSVAGQMVIQDQNGRGVPVQTGQSSSGIQIKTGD